MDEHEMKFDDERLTAYVLDELDNAERAEIEQAIETDDDLRARVEEIREATSALATAFAAETVESLDDARRETIETQADSRSSKPRVSLVRIGVYMAAAAAVLLVALPAINSLKPETILVADNADQNTRPDDPVAEAQWMYDQLKRDRDGIDRYFIQDINNPGAAEIKPDFTDPAQREMVKDLYTQTSQMTYDRVAAADGIGGSGGQAGQVIRGDGGLGGGAGGRVTGDQDGVVIYQDLTPSQVTGPEQTRPEIESLNVTRSESVERSPATTTAPAQSEVDPPTARDFGLNRRVALGSSQPQYAPPPPSTPQIQQMVAQSPTSLSSEQLSSEEIEQLSALGYLMDDSNAPSRERSARTTTTWEFQRSRVAALPSGSFRPAPQPAPAPITPGTEAYDILVENTFKSVTQDPLSTFSIDVDTASYANVRRFLMQNQLPPVDAVRVEELINYFRYDYAPPAATDEHPFAAHMAVAAAPWNPEHKLVRVGLKGQEIESGEQPPSNLVFLLDVSGSMNRPNKLPLVKQAIGLLARQLRSVDRVAIVVYAGSSGLVLESTPGSDTRRIVDALERLSAGGSTNGGAGIELAYNVARQHFIPGGVNRVILATDGDFNVGVTNQGDLVRLVEDRAKGGIFLTALGFGMGNLKDGTLEMLSNKGNGNYAYIDTFAEARKIFAEELTGTLVTIAKDVKIQIEFNPALVSHYRLIGYENRGLAPEDFNDDRKDAGEIGAGHTVTALYEVVPVGVEGPRQQVDPLRYQSQTVSAPPVPERGDVVQPLSNELLTLKLRYKQPEGDTSTLMEYHLQDTDTEFAQAGAEFQFATAVAAFGMKLRDSQHVGATTWQDVMGWAENGLARDDNGYRAEFLQLARTASQLKPDYVRSSPPEPMVQTKPQLIRVMRLPDGKARVQIRSHDRWARWYDEGESFEGYQVLRVDPATDCVELFDERVNRPIEICKE